MVENPAERYWQQVAFIYEDRWMGGTRDNMTAWSRIKCEKNSVHGSVYLVHDCLLNIGFTPSTQ